MIVAGVTLGTRDSFANDGSLPPGLDEVTFHAPPARGATSLSSVPVAPGEAQYGVQRTTAGAALRWPHGCLELAVSSAGTRFQPGQAEVDAIRRAAATWETEIGACSTVSIGVAVADGVVSARDGKSTVVFRDDDWCRPAAGSEAETCHDPAAIAVTRVIFSVEPGHEGEIQEADIEINSGGFALSIAGNTSSSAAEVRDLEAVVAHEIGHLLGLTHNCSEGGPEQAWPTDHADRRVPRCSDAAARAELTNATMYYQFDDVSEDKAALEASDVVGGCAVTASVACERAVRSAGCSAGPATGQPAWLLGLLVLWRSRRRRAWIVAYSLALWGMTAHADSAPSSRPASARVHVRPFEGAPSKSVRTQTLDLVEEYWRLGSTARDACAIVDGTVRKRRLTVTVRGSTRRGADATSREMSLNDAGRLARHQRARLRGWLARTLDELCSRRDGEDDGVVAGRSDAATTREPEPTSTVARTATVRDPAPLSATAPTEGATSRTDPRIASIALEKPEIETPAAETVDGNTPLAAAHRGADRPSPPSARSSPAVATAAPDVRVALSTGLVRRTLDSTSARHGVRASYPRAHLAGELVPIEVAGWLGLGLAASATFSQFEATADGFDSTPFRATHDSVQLGVVARRAPITVSLVGERRRDRFTAMSPELVAVLPTSTIDLAALKVAGRHGRGRLELHGALTAAAVVRAAEPAGRPRLMQRAGEVELAVGAAFGRAFRFGIDASAAELRATTAGAPLSDRRFVLGLTLGWVH